MGRTRRGRQNVGVGGALEALGLAVLLVVSIGAVSASGQAPAAPTGTWVPAGATLVHGLNPLAVALPDGGALLAGGMPTTCTSPVRTTEIYNPATNT